MLDLGPSGQLGVGELTVADSESSEASNHWRELRHGLMIVRFISLPTDFDVTSIGRLTLDIAARHQFDDDSLSLFSNK